MTYFEQITQSLLSLFYPTRCLGCGATGSLLCHTCQAGFTFLKPPQCLKCGYFLTTNEKICLLCQAHPLTDLNSARSVVMYENPCLKSAIHQFKYKNKHAVSQEFARLLQQCYQANQFNTDIIVPVPLHKARQRERGYNQSALLAKQLARLIDQPVDTRVLIRNRATERQVDLNATQRQANVADAFNCISDNLANKIVLLIDDVFTTGATLNACAKALKKTQVKAVHGLTLARAV